MTEWSLPRLLSDLHRDIHQRLQIVRTTMGHPGAKGDASENVWIKMLGEYLPQRYSVAKAFVVDSLGQFSDQIDVVIFDRQYSPFIFSYEGQTVIPAESVYAVFEAKQSMDAGIIDYAQKKVASVRSLHRTSLPIPHAGGTFPPKAQIPIIGGVLSLDCDWSPAFGPTIDTHLRKDLSAGLLSMGCSASHGHFVFDAVTGTYRYDENSKPATAFLFQLIAALQFSGTVPMIDIDAYAQWLLADDA